MKKIFGNNGKKVPLMRRMIAPLLAVAIIQAVIFYASLALSNTMGEINKNSEAMLMESSAKRALYIETEMTRKWNNIPTITSAAQASYKAIASKYALTVEEFLASDKYTSDFLMNISDDMLASMRINSANGVFFVLSDSTNAPDSSVQKNYRGVLFSDTDPASSPSDYSDIVMLRGSSAISKAYSIPLDMNWTDRFRFNPTKTDMDYYFRPASEAAENPYADSSSLGYWSRPFYLSEKNIFHSDLLIAYSEPVIIDNVVIGTVGITVSVDMISKFLPSEEAAGNDSGCYALISYTEGNDFVTVDAVSETYNGFEQYDGKILKFVPVKDSILKEVRDVELDGSQAYSARTELSLYPEDSPFAKEKWAIAAISSSADIYADFNSVRTRLIIALIISAVFGTVMVYVTAKYATKPIKALAQNVRSCGQHGTISMIDTDISEIHDLSEMLNTLSSKRSEYQNELITERERYLLTLQSINDNILEYDCTTDIFYMRYFRSQDKNGVITTKEYPNFTSLVRSGAICHKDYIKTMLDFINGLADENGTYFRILSSKGDGSYIWTFAKSRNIYDSEGKLLRVIASARDVTKEKEKELMMLELERCDPVTKFYNVEYGDILLSRFVREYGGSSAISAILRILDLENILNRYGQVFCSAVLEEVAAVIRRNIPQNFVVYKGGMDEFVMITTLTSRDEARAFFRKLIDEISAIYTGGHFRIESVVGAYIRIQDEPIASSKLKTRFASEAAYRYREEFGGIVFADEVTHKSDFVKSFRNNGPHDFLPFGKVKLEEVTDIIAFAFNIFEKADDISVALEVFLKKAGRMLGMDRILMFYMNKDYYVVRLAMQWNADGMAPIKMKNFISGKAAYTEFEKKFIGIKYKITDKVMFERNASSLQGKVSSAGTPYSVPMTDNDAVTGVMVYELHEQNDDESMIACLCELTKIISAYISKSRTSRESRAKSEFLSKMSHEIRTPMNAIIGMTAIAMSGENVSDSTMECLKKIDKSSHYLLALINDILDMSRIESGKMTTEETYLNLEELIAQLDTMIRVQTENKGIWLRVETDTPHIHLLGDPLKLNQVLVNILGNAVKFTSSGGIHFRVSESAAENDTVNVTFSVKDTGIGISEENAGRIFNSFEQADRDTVRKYGGTGLGLAISSNLVHLLGGKLEVRSEVGKGSEFFFTIPMKITAPAADSSDSTSAEIRFSEKRILIVEDDELNIEIAKTLIEAEGIQTELAENGQDAVDKFRSSEENYYDAILMDIRMPVMDGLEATKQIRSSDRTDAFTVPIIAMTANAFDEDMKKSVECGMNGHLTKPIDMNKVMAVFRRIWSAK